MKYLKKHMYVSTLIACVISLGVFLVATNPADVSVGLLVVPVVLVFFVAFCASQLLLMRLRLLKDKPRKQRIVALFCGSLLTVILILQSTGGISGVDVLLVALIIAVSGLYISKF